MRALSLSRRSLLASLVSLVLCVALPIDAAADEDPPPTPARILLMGDSLTQGSAGDYTWRYRLWQHLEDTGTAFDLVGPRTDLRDLAHKAWGNHDYVDPDFDQDHTAQWGASFAVPAHDPAELVRTHSPDVVVLLMGVNDLWLFKRSPSRIEETVREFVAAVRSADPATDLVLVRIPATSLAGVPELNDRLVEVAADLSDPLSRIAVAHADSGFVTREDNWDAFHPNARGEVKIAAAVADALALLDIGQPYPRPLPTVPLGPRMASTLAATAGDESATLEWQPGPGVLDEHVWARPAGTGSWTQLSPVVQGAPYVVAELDNWQSYEFVLQPVKGWWAAEDDVRSNVVAVTPLPTPPGPTEIESVDALDHGAQLTWTPAERATWYHVWLDDLDDAGDAVRLPDQYAATTAALSGLIAGARYEIRVQPVNDGIAGERSAPLTVVPEGPVPPAPTAVLGTTTPTGSATIGWAPAEHATSYEVSWRDQAANEPWHTAQVPAPSSELTLTGLASAGSYDFTVRAWHMRIAGGTSDLLTIRIPRLPPVTDVVTWSARRDVARIAGRPVDGAESYRVYGVARGSCERRPRPGAFSLVNEAPTLPTALVRTAAPAVWLRVVAVRSGIDGRSNPASTSCTIVG